MLIVGSGGDEVPLGKLEARQCPVCDHVSAFRASLIYKYFHIWFLFSWVTKRHYTAICERCNSAQPLDAQEAKKLFPKDPLSFISRNGWMVGVALMALIFVPGMIVQHAEKQTGTECLAAPRINDIYLAELSAIEGSGYPKDKRMYGAMKLVRVDGNTLILAFSNEAIGSRYKVQTALALTSEAAYDMEDLQSFSKEKVQELYKQGVISEVKRTP